jgi:hypothetical protein
MYTGDRFHVLSARPSTRGSPISIIFLVILGMKGEIMPCLEFYTVV